MCNPVSNAWKVATYPYGCRFRLTDINTGQAACNIATDLIVFAMPLPVILRMTMRRRERNGILVVLLLGAIAVVASAVRLYMLAKFNWTVGDLTCKYRCRVDVVELTIVGESALSGTWSIIEINLALISCSLFALRLLFVRQRRKASQMIPASAEPRRVVNIEDVYFDRVLVNTDSETGKALL